MDSIILKGIHLMRSSNKDSCLQLEALYNELIYKAKNNEIPSEEPINGIEKLKRDLIDLGSFYTNKKSKIDCDIGRNHVREEFFNDVFGDTKNNEEQSKESLDMHVGFCFKCNCYDSETTNQILECQDCHQHYHQNCHSPNVTDDINDPRFVWYCEKCLASLSNDQIINKEIFTDISKTGSSNTLSSTKHKKSTKGPTIRTIDAPIKTLNHFSFKKAAINTVEEASTLDALKSLPISMSMKSSANVGIYKDKASFPGKALSMTRNSLNVDSKNSAILISPLSAPNSLTASPNSKVNIHMTQSHISVLSGIANSAIKPKLGLAGFAANIQSSTTTVKTHAPVTKIVGNNVSGLNSVNPSNTTMPLQRSINPPSSHGLTNHPISSSPFVPPTMKDFENRLQKLKKKKSLIS